MKLYRIKNRQSFGFSAENPTGQKMVVQRVRIVRN